MTRARPRRGEPPEPETRRSCSHEIRPEPARPAAAGRESASAPGRRAGEPPPTRGGRRGQRTDAGRAGGGLRRLVLWALVLLGTGVLFSWARGAALVERGYEAAGGEWLVWLIPGLVWIGAGTAREMRGTAVGEGRSAAEGAETGPVLRRRAARSRRPAAAGTHAPPRRAAAAREVRGAERRSVCPPENPTAT